MSPEATFFNTYLETKSRTQFAQQPVLSVLLAQPPGKQSLSPTAVLIWHLRRNGFVL